MPKSFKSKHCSAHVEATILGLFPDCSDERPHKNHNLYRRECGAVIHHYPTKGTIHVNGRGPRVERTDRMLRDIFEIDHAWG